MTKTTGSSSTRLLARRHGLSLKIPCSPLHFGLKIGRLGTPICQLAPSLGEPGAPKARRPANDDQSPTPGGLVEPSAGRGDEGETYVPGLRGRDERQESDGSLSDLVPILSVNARSFQRNPDR